MAIGSAQRNQVLRFLPLAIVALGLALFLSFGLQRYVTLDALRAHRAWLATLVATRPVFAAMTFVLAYAAIVACSIPVGAAMTIAGGFLFGVVEGATLVVGGATLGATAIFLAAKTALSDSLRRRFRPIFAKMEDGFRANAFNYLLVLRLVPLFPFFLVNLGAGVLGVPTRTYVIGTLLGIIPGTLVYVGLGNGLGALFDKGVEPNLRLIFEPAILVPLLGLAVLSLIPVAWRATRRGS